MSQTFLNIQYTGIHFYISGLMWIQQPNGDLFCFNPYTTRHNSSIKVIEVPPPEPGCGQPFKCLCVLSSVVWVLMPNGKIYVRTDIRAGCPQGLNWVHLNMQQLGISKENTFIICCLMLIYFSCIFG